MITSHVFDMNVVRSVASMSESRICGFILYKSTDASIVKVMRDPDYLRAIDEISGERWPVFAVKPLDPSRFEIKSSCMPGYIGMMITEEVDPKANLPIINFFGLDNTSDTPCFVLFCWDDNDELLVTHYKLTNRSIEDAYNSIIEVIEEISKSEAMILPEYRKQMGVYRQARESVEALKFKKRFQKNFSSANDFMGFISSFF